MRFPLITTLCDSPHRSGHDPQKLRDHPLTIARVDSSMPPSVPPQTVQTAPRAPEASSRSYLQGYTDALLVHDTRDSLFATDRSTIESVLPDNMQPFAARYPYVTIAALGAAGGALFAGTSYLTARLIRRGLQGRRMDSRLTSHVTDGLSKDTERRLIAEMQAMQRVCRDEIRDLQGRMTRSVGAGVRGMPEQEMEALIERVVSKARAPLLDSGSKQTAKSLMGGEVDLDQVIDKAVERARKSVVNQRQRTGDKALTKEDVKDSTREVFDQLVLDARDRRNELQGFRSEMIGELQMMRDQMEELRVEMVQVRQPDYMSDQTFMDEATERYVQKLRDQEMVMADLENEVMEGRGDDPDMECTATSPEDTELPESQVDSPTSVDKGIQAALDDCSALRAKDPIQYDPNDQSPVSRHHREKPTYYPNPEPAPMSAEDETYKEMARQDLYADIKAYKDYYQSVMKESGEMPAGTDADDMVEQLERAQDAAATHRVSKKNKKKAKRAARSGMPPGHEKSEDSPESSGATGPTMEQERSSGILADSENAWSGLDMFPPPRTEQTRESSSPRAPSSDAAEINTACFPHPEEKEWFDSWYSRMRSEPRTGVDDSGDWYLMYPVPDYRNVKDMTYTATIFHQPGQRGLNTDDEWDRFLEGNSPSRYKIRLIGFYPDDGIAYIDGRYWQCAMIGPKIPQNCRDYKLTHLGTSRNGIEKSMSG